MPRWEDVVAYEEGSLETPLQAGYPRFVYLKTVQKLFDKAQDLCAAVPLLCHVACTLAL